MRILLSMEQVFWKLCTKKLLFVNDGEHSWVLLSMAKKRDCFLPLLTVQEMWCSGEQGYVAEMF